MMHDQLSIANLRKPFSASVFCITLLGFLAVASLEANEAGNQDFGDFSLEDLLDVTVTSVSKREQNLSEAAAAIAVLRGEDLLNSPVHSIPDALRLVPGLNVGSVNANEWAVSSRGFNSKYAADLLVLVDGRAVYYPFWAGVFWDMQRPIMEDLDRIEVIRGPGGTIWGANAVNGVINIVTRSARDTQGGLLYAGGGDIHQTQGGFRYGNRLGGNTYYRVFAGYQKTADFPDAAGRDNGDGWEGRQAGFRVDHYPDSDSQLTWQADWTSTDPLDSGTGSQNANTLFRYNRDLTNGSSLQVQAYYDHLNRNDLSLIKASADTAELSFHHNIFMGDRHDLIWGGGFRTIDTDIDALFIPGMVRNNHIEQKILSIFVQDELSLLRERLKLTAGVKAEKHDAVGWEYQPSVKGLYSSGDNLVFWASLSRAIRTPSLVEGEDLVSFVFGAPFQGMDGGFYLPTVLGNLEADSEEVTAHELGVRFFPDAKTSLDVALFYNEYSNVLNLGDPQGFIPGSPFGTAPLRFENNTQGNTYGAEILLRKDVSEAWELEASLTLLEMDIYVDSRLNLARDSSKLTPHAQAVLRSLHTLSESVDFSLNLRYVGEIQQVPSYLTADLQLSWILQDGLHLTLAARNLLEDQQLEQPPLPTARLSEVPRSFFGKVTWNF